MRIGVIGVGRIGTVHAETLVAHPEVDAVVLGDVDQERAKQVADALTNRRDRRPLAAGQQAAGQPGDGQPGDGQPGDGQPAAEGPAVEDADVEAAEVDDLIATVDAVVIAAASSSHADLICRSADAGLPTFCEKPIALDLPSTAEVVDRVRATGAPLQMGFQRRFDRGYRSAHDLVHDGSLGRLYVVRMAGHDPEPPHPEYIPVSGGIFRDFAVHDFDALRFVTGREVEEVYADGSVIAFPLFDEFGDVDTAVATLRLSDGALAILSSTRHDPLGYDIRMELFGSADSISVGLDRRTPLRSVESTMSDSPDSPYRNFRERFAPAYRAEMDAFIDVAAGRRESPCTAEDALEALRTAVACDVSRAEHRPVRLAEVA
jgi:myo-inositol 2-dehydrogenase / D-chiro-inositol 1-dehydrogenase